MKKTLLAIFSIFTAGLAISQSIIPNAGFENWTSLNYEIPQNYTESSNPEAYFKSGAPFNCVKTTDAYSGTYALQLTTVAGTGSDTSMGYVVNCNPSGGNPCQWTGGIPYNLTPTGITGYYKSNIMAGDSTGILMVFKNAGVCLGTYMYKFGGVHSSYTSFSFTFSPALSATPDTVLFAAISSDIFNNVMIPGSTIQLDSIAFTGVVNQPSMFNGDFETWQTQTITIPDNWNLNGDRGNGISQTLDAYSGTYAVELQTILGDNNGNPVARGAGVSTGYNYCPQSGPCFYMGGTPFSNQVDTLAFFYKYVPSGNDSAVVSLNFKKNGNSIWNAGGSIHASSVYNYMEVPFNIGTAPDTVIVDFQSSYWNDTALTFVGSSLKIDGVHFKSELTSTGISKNNNESAFFVYPNPGTGVFNILLKNSHSVSMQNVRVIDMLGKLVFAKSFKNNFSVFDTTLDLSKLDDGNYLIVVETSDDVYKTKISKTK